MSWSQGILYFKDALGANQPIIGYNDGTNSVFAHATLDNTGALINPSSADLQTTGNNYLALIQASVAAAQPAGTNIIGKVTTDQTTHGTTDLIAADITKVNGVAVPVGHGVAATALRVELPTDGTGVVGLNNGTNTVGAVAVAGKIVTSSTITRPNNTTAYASGYLVANNTSATTVNSSITSGTYTIAAARGTDIVSALTRVSVKKSGTSVTNAIYRVHFYNSQPTVTNGDGAAWLTGITGYLGFFDVTVDEVFSDGAYGSAGYSRGNMLTFAPVSGTSNLFWLIEVRGAYTPVANETYTISCDVN